MQTSPFFDEIRAEGLEKGLEEGWARGARALVLRQGRLRFGKAPTRKQLRVLEHINDRAQLEALADRVLDAKTWADLLA
jgi:Domain of unknown function (DUF4351)